MAADNNSVEADTQTFSFNRNDLEFSLELSECLSITAKGLLRRFSLNISNDSEGVEMTEGRCRSLQQVFKMVKLAESEVSYTTF